MTETTPSPTSKTSSNPRPSAFARLRVVILVVLLVVLLAILWFVWGIFQNQQRAQFIISGEDLFRTGIIDRIVTRGPSQPAPSPTVSQEAQETQRRANAPTPIAQGPQTYFIRSSGDGPVLTRLMISEFDPAVGERQGIQVETQFTQPVESVTATLITDNGQQTFPLTLTQGSPTQGSWTVEWTNQDTHDEIYTLILEASSTGFPTSKVTLSFR